MDIAFMLGCWAVCLAAGHVIAPGTALGGAMLIVWHFAMLIMVHWMGVTPQEVSDDN